MRCLFLLLLSPFFSYAQQEGKPSAVSPSMQVIKMRSAAWNNAFNNRDSNTLYAMYDTGAVFISGGARQIGKEQCQQLFRRLFTRRPDIITMNTPDRIDVNFQWKVAFETGDWTESWTEKGDTTRSELRGRYSQMWRFADGDWRIVSSIFTPLQCKGSYCDKRK